MKLPRRNFIALLGSATISWPLVARGQQPMAPVIGFLHATSIAGAAAQVDGYRKGLSESGYAEGQNLLVEYRWAEGKYDRLPALAAELVERHVAVLVAGGGNAPAQAAKAATANIPIVFISGSDPVRAGLVDGLSRPGGNVTGVSMILSALMAKSLDLVHQLVPKATAIGALVNPHYSDASVQVRELLEAARAIKLQVQVVNASTEHDVETAFATVVQQGVAALLVANDPFLNDLRDQIVGLAARHALPAIYSTRDFVMSGGLMSYGPSLSDAYRQAGIYTARILKGAKPSDLPVVQPTKFDLIVNLKTAKALGFEIPPTLLALADEVIE
jgi:putative ABC transport system substrate-binding protein